VRLAASAPRLAALPCALLLAACMPTSPAQTSAPQALRTTSRVVYYHPAFAAGPSIITRGDGSVLDERRDEPFGAAIDGDLAADPHNALNKETDATTGWSDHGARWLAPEAARWLTPDPPVKAPDPKFMIEPWGLHPYQYVEQNPVVFWDPDGRDKARTEPGSFVISFRRYVPSATFGGGFVGDDRGPSADAGARHRTGLNIAFDPRAQTVTGVSGTSSGIEAVGGFARFLSTPRMEWEPGACFPHGDYQYKSMPDVEASAGVVGRRGANMFIRGASAASDNLIWFPFPPNMDTQVTFGATLRDGKLAIAGEITGDPYPALDIVVSDAAGNTVLLGGARSVGALGISMLGGNGGHAIATFEASIDVDASGTFTGTSSATVTDRNADQARMQFMQYQRVPPM
jgi:RHS repeat-associated protein